MVLLPNWFAARDEDLVYYFNPVTDETTWAVPLRWPRGEYAAVGDAS